MIYVNNKPAKITLVNFSSGLAVQNDFPESPMNYHEDIEFGKIEDPCTGTIENGIYVDYKDSSSGTFFPASTITRLIYKYVEED